MADAADVFKIEIAWATAPWATTPTWVDITDISDTERQKRGVIYADLDIGGSIIPGVPSPPGTLTFEANNQDADWDSENASSVFGASNLLRLKKVRVSASDDGSTFTQIWGGYIDDISPAGDSIWSTAMVTCVDILSLLAEIDVDITRPAELTGQRVDAILDAAGVPAGERTEIENGNVMMPAGTFSADALSLLKECAKAESGWLYVGPAGKINFYDRHRPLSSPYDARTFSITSNPADANSTIRMAPIRRSLGGTRRVTAVTATSAVTGNSFTYDDTPTDTPVSTPQDAPLNIQTIYDADAETNAEALYKWLEYNETRLRTVPVFVWGLGSSLPTSELTSIEAGEYQPLTRCEVQMSTPVGFASDWNFEARVVGVRHRVTAEAWEAVLTVDPHDTTWEVASSGWAPYSTSVTISTDLGAL